MTDKKMSSSNNNQQPHYKRYSRSSLQKLKVIISTISLLVLFQTSCYAYRVGDVVDTYLLLDATRSDVLRSQMPKFGIGYIDHVQFDLPPLAKTFALQFEDGLWTTPVTYLSQSGGGGGGWQFLERVQIQFIYSKSGTGAVHAVTTKDVVYSSEQRRSFIVDYQWVEEETVYLSAGQTVLFLAAVVSCVYFLLVSCGIIFGSNDGSVSGGSTAGHLSSSSVPKWD